MSFRCSKDSLKFKLRVLLFKCIVADKIRQFTKFMKPGTALTSECTKLEQIESAANTERKALTSYANCSETGNNPIFRPYKEKTKPKLCMEKLNQRMSRSRQQRTASNVQLRPAYLQIRGTAKQFYGTNTTSKVTGNF